MELSDLQSPPRTITVQVDKADPTKTVDVTYSPSAYTPMHEQAYAAQVAAEDIAKSSAVFLGFLDGLLLGWTLTENGQPLGVDRESLARLPMSFLGLVMTDIAEDVGKGM